MKPLIVLIAVSGGAGLAIRVITGAWDFRLAASIGMSAMLLFTAIGHFAFPTGMSMMLPQFVPFKSGIIYATGALEGLAAIGLAIPCVRTATGWFLVAFFILLLPANVKAAINRVDYQKGALTGPGIRYLWFRVPLQILFIVWVWYCAIQH